MKKFLTFCLSLMLVFSSSLVFSACDDKGKTKIAFDNGNYNCTVNQDSLVINDSLSQENLEEFYTYASLDNDTEVNSVETLKTYLSTSFENTYFQFNDYEVKIFTYEITDTLFVEACLTIDTYKFKKNVLTFTDDTQSSYTVTKNDDGTLTLKCEAKYDFSTTEIADFKPVFTIEMTLVNSINETAVELPTPEKELFNEKTISKQYKLSSISGVEGYFNELSDLMALVGINSAEEYQDYLNNNSSGTLILFNDFTLYYEANVDMSSLFDNILGTDTNLNLSTKIGYIYSYEQGSQENTFNALYETATAFTFTVSDNGSTITISIQNIGGSTFTYTFTEL